MEDLSESTPPLLPVQPHTPASLSFHRSLARPLPYKGEVSKEKAKRVLILYTGGTIGCCKDATTGAYAPDPNFLVELLGTGLLANEKMPLLAVSVFDPPLDSSDMNCLHWSAVAKALEEEYSTYDGFVVVHGTDTMAYTASALSFALEGLSKTVVVTGAQIPLSVVRSDGVMNLTNSCLVAAYGGPQLAEVVVVFDSHVLRGNRTTKFKAWGISGFKSFNYPLLGESGVRLVSFDGCTRHADPRVPFRCKPAFSSKVVVVTVHPGIERYAPDLLELYASRGVRGIVLECFGIGNAPSDPSFIGAIQKATERQIVVLVISKCPSGSVSLGAYSGGYALGNAGCVCGHNMTTEAAFTKLSWLLGDTTLSYEKICALCGEDLRGEVTPGFFVHHNTNHRILV